MTRDAIIRELYDTHFVENYARQFAGKADSVYFDDIVAELYCMICELPEHVVTSAYRQGGINAIRRYVSGLIAKQMRSTNSRIYRKYTRHVYNEQPTQDFTAWHELTD